MKRHPGQRQDQCCKVTADPEECLRMRMRMRFLTYGLQLRGKHNKNDAFKLINLALQRSID